MVWTWFGRGSDVVRMWVGGGSDVFSDLMQTVWQKLRESGFQHAGTPLSGVRKRRFGYLENPNLPWKLKPGLINRVLVAVIFEASKCL